MCYLVRKCLQPTREGPLHVTSVTARLYYQSHKRLCIHWGFSEGFVPETFV